MKPVDIIVLLITVTICCVLVLAGLEGWSPWYTQVPIPGEKMETVKATIASLVTIISIYVGHKIKGHDK